MTIEEYQEVKDLLLKIVEATTDFKNKVFLVGGCLRQSIAEIDTINDIDLYVDFIGGAEKFVEYLRNNFPIVTTDYGYYKRSKTYKFSLVAQEIGLIKIEVSDPIPSCSSRILLEHDQPSYILDDALERDFTVNAVYQRISKDWFIIDPLSGKNSIKSRKLELCGNNALIKDPVRKLRGVRLIYDENYVITQDLFDQFSYSEDLEKIPRARIKQEFVKILNSGLWKSGVEFLIVSGLMKTIIPELIDNYTYNQKNKYHEYVLGEHILSVLKKLPADSSLELKLAALLHDISKPFNYQEKEDGQRSYHGHELSSADMAGDILRKLTFSEHTISKVQFLVKNHMRLKQHYNYKSCEYTGLPKHTRKIAREIGEDLEDLLFLIDADNMSHSSRWNMPGQVDSFRRKLKLLPELSQKKVIQIPVTGKDVMDYFQISTGPKVGEILKLIEEIWDEDPNNDKEILLKKAYEQYQKH